MASTLQITDGTTTVNLLNTTGLYLKENGWKAAVAQEDENGDYQDMIEVITCTWMETTDDDRAETLKKLKRLDRKAREHWRKRLVDDWVWLEASTHSETDTRYAIIKSIDVKELDSRHWQANQPSEITLVIKHVLWWGIAPNGTPTTVVSSTTVANKEVSTTHNHVQITPANVKGDAPALAIIEIDRVTGLGYHSTISRKRGSSSDLDNYISNLTVNADLRSGSGLTINADATLPGGQYGRWSGTTIGIAYFDIPNDLEYFSGYYQLYAICRASVADTITIAYDSGYNTSFGTPRKGNVTVPQTFAGWYSVYLGSIEILQRGLAPNRSSPTEYVIGITCTKAASSNFDIALLWLVPSDDGIFYVEDANRSSGGVYRTTVLDGAVQRAYAVDGSNIITDNNMTYRGQFLELEPNTNQRYYFLQGAGSFYDASDTSSIVVKAIYRYTSLRGND